MNFFTLQAKLVKAKNSFAC